MVYLDAARKLLEEKYPEKKFQPDGAYYYLVKDPMIELKDRMEIEEEELEQLLDKELQMAGFGYNKKEDRAVKKQKIRPNESEMEAVISYARGKMKEIGNEILHGNIEAKPCRIEGNVGCEYCTYKGICGFDEKIPGYEYRTIEALSEDDALAKMKCSD